MRKSHVFFISSPNLGNLVPTVEFARHLTKHDRRLSATLLIITVPERPLINSYVQSQSSSSADGPINFVYLPTVDPPSPDQYQSSLAYVSVFVEKHKPQVKQAIIQLISTHSDSDSDSVRATGLFVDMFTTSLIDVANELGIPSYLFFASPASFMGLMLHMPMLDAQFATEFVDSDTGLIVPKDPATELIIPSFANPLPPPILPTSVLKRNEDGYSWYLNHSRRYLETKGIIINTFQELEKHALSSISMNRNPPVYAIGPVIDLIGPAQWEASTCQQERIMKWLDKQSPSSIVFLCFGSMGSFGKAQLKEIAFGLERAGFGFLWAIRHPPKGKLDLPGEYPNVDEVLPEGFVDRTAEIGLVCGWVPQVTILAHPAVGGFVTHCGWNSILESLWYGVPIATWPVYAEQQMNAFQLVKELGLAVGIRLDYREGCDLVRAEEVESGILHLMNGDDEVRAKFKEMGQKSRMAVMENGSSYKSLECLIDGLTAEI